MRATNNSPLSPRCNTPVREPARIGRRCDFRAIRRGVAMGIFAALVCWACPLHSQSSSEATEKPGRDTSLSQPGLRDQSTNVDASSAAQRDPVNTDRSLGTSSMHFPSGSQWRRVLLLADHNTRVVVLGTTLLGLAAGLIGSFALLRKRALMGDALSHASLPGIALAFIIATQAGFNGKSLPLLLAGASITGLLSVFAILFIRTQTRLAEDTALGVVLSVFFGSGVALLGIVQQMDAGHSAGLESFIYGKTASMLSSDTWLIGATGFVSCLVCLLLRKEFKLLCFDDGFAGSQGFPITLLDSLLMILVQVVTIVGLQAVGLILVIAMLVTPAAAARFWTQQLNPMLLIASGLGAASGMIGSTISALFPQLPSGAMIVLVATGMFGFSMLFGPARGVVARWRRRRQLNAKIDRQHLLRGVYELLESSGHRERQDGSTMPTVTFDKLLALRSWTARRLTKEIRKAEAVGLVEFSNGRIRITARGFQEAKRITHEHRLWEIYLITHAEIAPSHVDRDADAIEHVLQPAMIDKLEKLLLQSDAQGMAQSPHPIEPST